MFDFDFEFFKSRSIEDRYKSISQLAKTFGVISVGLSCFSIEKPIVQRIRIVNKTYNLLTFADEFLVEAKSMKFLVDHGFDLNELFRQGLRHYRGNDNKSTKDEQHSVRSILNQITRVKVPIVLHNGFIDLVFLYQNFYADLPDVSMKFLADLEEIFSGGIFDTKYISEFHVHSSSASFLEYLYKKALYENTQLKTNTKLDVSFFLLANNSNSLQLSDFQMNLSKKELTEKKICHNYSTYGYCSRIETCNKSHDVNTIIQAELNKKKPKSTLKQQEEEEEEETVNVKETASTEKITETVRSNQNQAHSAGIDSFMTGYVMLNFLNKLTKFKMTSDSESTSVDSTNKTPIHLLNEFDLALFKNKVYLTGKDYPLMVVKSNFASTSANHKEKRKNSFS